MAKASNQKLKILYLYHMLEERTDEQHPMTVKEMMAALEEQGVPAGDRRSIYSDIEQLRLYGLDIVGRKFGSDYGYFVASRHFELPELKLLVDAVQSSRFITHRKTDELIRKVESLGSIYDARALQRQVYVVNRIKTMNESIYYNVDGVHAAIAGDRQISFKYFEWVLDKSTLKPVKQFRRGGEAYTVSPLGLTWDDENYYMIAFDGAENRIKHFRVDKMSGIAVTDLPREGEKSVRDLDMALYSKKMFGMFGGAEEQVSILFDNGLIGVVVDRFGKDVFLSRPDDDHFILTVNVAVSPQFLSWVFGFGGKARIISPQSVSDKLKQMAKEIVEDV